MRYAEEVIGLLSADPGRDFRMREIMRAVDPDASQKRVRVGVWRALTVLVEMDAVIVSEAARRGGAALYRWRLTSSPA